MAKVIIAFDEKATEDQQKFYEETVKRAAEVGLEVESIGGGIKNPN